MVRAFTPFTVHSFYVGLYVLVILCYVGDGVKDAGSIPAHGKFDTSLEIT